MRFGSTVKVLAECKLKYYRIVECPGVPVMTYQSGIIENCTVCQIWPCSAQGRLVFSLRQSPALHNIRACGPCQLESDEGLARETKRSDDAESVSALCAQRQMTVLSLMQALSHWTTAVKAAPMISRHQARDATVSAVFNS